MMKKLLLASALVLGSWTGAAQAVTVVTFAGGSGTVAPGTNVYQNFDAIATGSAIGPNAGVLSTSISGVAERPSFGSTGNYAAVFNGGSYTTTFGATSVFSFVLGSLDTYNTLTLRYADGTTTSLIGSAIVGASSIGSGTADRNGVVSYQVTSGSLLTGATFTSTSNAFEFDNLATAVPEPAAWGMMIMGFGLVGGVLRRRPSTKVKFA